MTRRDFEVKIVELEGRGGNVDAKEGGRIPIEDLDRGIQG